MRVLHVIDSMVRGGAESLILEHIRHAGPGVESMVCALNRSGPSLEIAASLGARTRLLGKGANHLEGLRQLATLMREWRVEVVNGHNPTGALYATPAARWADVPVVFRSEHSIHYPGRHSRVYPAIEAVLTAMTQPAASSRTRFGLWLSAREMPNRCSLWNWPPATSRAPPARVHPRIMRATRGDVWYPARPMTVKTSATGTDACISRRSSRGSSLP